MSGANGAIPSRESEESQPGGKSSRTRRFTNGAAGPKRVPRRSPSDRAVVEIVSVDCADDDPGMTAGGLNEQITPGGRLEQPRGTAVANAPPWLESVTWYTAACPAVIVTEAGDTPTEKLATVICRSTAGENATPLLLADTLTLLVPNEQSSVAPGDVPQPPVQLNLTRGQCSGSVNPSCVGDRLAPIGVFPPTVMVAGPWNAGSIFWTAANASARP